MHVQGARFKLVAVVVAVAALAMSTATASAAAASKRHHPAISAAKAFVLPSAKACVTGRALSFRIVKLRHVTWTGATVNVNGRRFETISRRELSRAIKLTRLPTGTFVLSITARPRVGRSVTITRTYKTCATPTSTAEPGSYSGDDSQGYSLAFYVSSNGQQVQDVSVNDVSLSCSNGSSTGDNNFTVAQTAIAASGNFAATTSENAVVGGAPATIKRTFSGHFQGPSIAGQVSETITFTTGTTYTCTSKTLSWTAALGSQGSQVAAAPQPGSYSGDDSQGYSLAFYVSGSGQQVQDVSVNDVRLSCSNGSSTGDDDFSIAQLAITAGAFTGSSTQTTATESIVYTFTGHFHGLNTSGNTRVAGQVSETITFITGTSYTCTSDNLSWTAALGSQGSQVAAPPQPGSYLGDDSQGYSLKFTVSADSQQVQNISVNDVRLLCSNGSSTGDSNFSIADATITSDDAFTGTSTQTTATESITYTFTGHFHGLNTSGNTRAAGQLVEVMSFTTGTTYTCTSDNLSWTAAL